MKECCRTRPGSNLEHPDHQYVSKWATEAEQFYESIKHSMEQYIMDFHYILSKSILLKWKFILFLSEN